MATLVEMFASQIGWNIGKYNVVVEGTSDVGILQHAATLHAQASGVNPLADDFAVVASGLRDDGGVEGVNRRLGAARQNADADRDANGLLKYRFIGLFDNDHAGKKAFRLASAIDRRVVRYRDVFLLHPNMPIANSYPVSGLEQSASLLNAPYSGLDWEIEDSLSESFKLRFQSSNPRAISNILSRGNRTHLELTREGKRAFSLFVRNNAKHKEMADTIRLICALRSYLGIPHSHIISP
ncbi:MAG: hypothetical protein KL863_20410 [Rhizobium sp.]|nr:hypothetical protein [Rhizobium sp.]